MSQHRQVHHHMKKRENTKILHQLILNKVCHPMMITLPLHTEREWLRERGP